MDRKWLPNLGELIDRLSIHQLKEVMIPEHKDKYCADMQDIAHDIGEIIKENDIQLSGKLIHAIIVIAQLNEHIWYNEAAIRLGSESDDEKLQLTHGLNGLRNATMNLILDLANDVGRKDYKVDCLAAEFKDWDIGLLHDD